MMLLTFTFRFKVKSPYFLRFIHRKQVLYHQLALKNSPHVTQLLGQKGNETKLVILSAIHKNSLSKTRPRFLVSEYQIKHCVSRFCITSFLMVRGKKSTFQFPS